MCRRIEEHIADMERARATLESNGLSAYWRIVRPRMFGGPFSEERWDEERERALRFAALPAPLGFGMTADDLVRTPTIVVTGGWNSEYEAIATALSARGAWHRVLAGAGHRPQDLPEFEDLLDEFLVALDSAPPSLR